MDLSKRLTANGPRTTGEATGADERMHETGAHKDPRKMDEGYKPEELFDKTGRLKRTRGIAAEGQPSYEHQSTPTAFYSESAASGLL
jgi:hypothetical protein